MNALNHWSWSWFEVFDEHRIGGADVLLVVVVTDDLQLVDAEGDFDSLVRRREEAQGVQSELKLRTHAEEDASFGLDAILPAELQSHNVLVLIGLRTRSNA